MDKDDSFPESLRDLIDADDVEILEVVGVEDDGTPVEREPSAAILEQEDPDEYLLDFDEPEADLPAEAAAETQTDYGEREPSDEEGEQTQKRLVRLRADYDNLRKRIDRERKEFELYANFALVGRLLPVMDNLERALAAAANDGGDAALLEGLVMIHRQLTDQLSNEGLTAIDALGRSFDPNLHDAVVTEPSTGFPPNTIMEELQKGYLFQDRVLRAAMVKVSIGVSDSGEDG